MPPSPLIEVHAHGEVEATALLFVFGVIGTYDAQGNSAWPSLTDAMSLHRWWSWNAISCCAADSYTETEIGL